MQIKVSPQFFDQPRRNVYFFFIQEPNQLLSQPSHQCDADRLHTQSPSTTISEVPP